MCSSDLTPALRMYTYPIIGDLPVSEITGADVIRVLDPVWLKTPETARRVRGRIQAVLDWCVARGERPEGENPASRGPLLRGLPKQPNGTRHHPAMPYADVPDFLRELQASGGMSARVLEFAILTAARAGEAFGARWDEIDFVAATWSVPASRMKAARAHRVPLTDAALAVLNRSKGQHPELVFPGARGRPLSSVTMRRLLGRMRYGQYTPHGFRASFKTWASEETEFDRDTVEAALAHIVGDRTEAAYQRGTMFGKRRKLMEAWAAFCGGTQ